MLALGRIALLHKERSYCQTGVFTEVVKVIGKWPKHMYYSRSGVINKWKTWKTNKKEIVRQIKVLEGQVHRSESSVEDVLILV